MAWGDSTPSALRLQGVQTQSRDTTLWLERILPRCRIDEPGGVLGQEQARLQQLTHDLAHALHIGRMAAVALFKGRTWVTLGQAFCCRPGEGQTDALAVAEFAIESWNVVEIPAGVGRQRHGNSRQAHPGHLIAIRIDLRHQGRIGFVRCTRRMHPVLQHRNTIGPPWGLDIGQSREGQRRRGDERPRREVGTRLSGGAMPAVTH